MGLIGSIFSSKEILTGSEKFTTGFLLRIYQKTTFANHCSLYNNRL